MRRCGNLWQRFIAFDNLYQAYRKARRGKQAKPAVAAFSLRLETELFRLQEQLQSGAYCPGAYHLFTIYERKPRQIAAAPFVDRVVHHALMRIIEPLIDPRFISDSYACRKGKGAHKAVERYQRWATRYRYALKMDVRRYFPSIDHHLLKAKIARHIKDPRILELFDLIIDTSPQDPRSDYSFPGDDLLTPLERPTGIPIGNLTSQFLANLYLNELDQYLKSELRLPAYLRYVDDLIVLDDDKDRLHEIRAIIIHLAAKDRLTMHAGKAQVLPVSDGVDVLGYQVFPGFRRLRNDNGHRFARKLRRAAKNYAAGLSEWSDFNPSVQSWIGHALHADTLGLREGVFSSTVFARDAGEEASRVARRLVEQQPEEGAFRQP